MEPPLTRAVARVRSLLAAYRKRRDSYARRLLGLRLSEWERFESEEVASQCFRTAWNGPGMGLRRGGVAVLLFACWWSVLHLDLSVEQQVAVTISSFLLIFLFDGIVNLSSAFIFRRLLTKHLRRAMNQNGMPICVECGYNLTGLSSGRCPECGASRHCE